MLFRSLGLIDGAELEFRALRAMASYSLYGHDSTVHVVRHAPVRTSAIAPPATLRGDWSRIDEDASAAACRLLAELPAAGDGVAAVLTGTITGVSHLSVAKRYACSLYFFWLVRVRSLAEDACHHRRCTNGECECTTDRCLHAPTAIFSIDDGTGDALARIDGDFELFWQLLIILGVYVVVAPAALLLSLSLLTSLVRVAIAMPCAAWWLLLARSRSRHSWSCNPSRATHRTTYGTHCAPSWTRRSPSAHCCKRCSSRAWCSDKSATARASPRCASATAPAE